MNISLSLFFDPLSVFFIVATIAVSFPAFIYSFGYLKGHYSARKILLGQTLFVLFVASMLLVVTVANAFTFLIVWELMTLISYFLVVFDSSQEKSIRAGTIYMVMAHAGTALLVAAIFLMYRHSGSFDLLAMRSGLRSLPALQKDILFLLLFFGFGTKAGIVPLHIWLPYAHPQAPSHISALMSGVMIKTAIYGIIRFIIFTLGVNSLWWGELVLIFGAVSCLVGIIYALMEEDLKTLLAYSSVENMGIILLGVGASMLFIELGNAPLTILAMCAGLYHLLNHAVFKGLLFLCAGSVYNATGTRNIEKLGGLIKRMPYTSFYFLTGSMAISALPPLNGFVSEWMTLIVLFLGALATAGGLKLFLSLIAAILALTGGLAAACFVKAFGITFLGKPRSPKADAARDCGASMRTGMGILAAFALILALGAPYVTWLLTAVSGSATRLSTKNMSFSLNFFYLKPHPGGSILLSPPLLAALLAVSAFAAFGITRSLFGKRKVAVGSTWDCGYYKLTSRNEYTATGFSKPFRIAFSFFLLPFRRVQKVKESNYHIKSFSYETSTTKIFRKYIYQNFLTGLFRGARSMRGIQTGSVHLYLGYICLTLILLLLLMGRF